MTWYKNALIHQRLRWNCHDLEVSLESLPRALDRYVQLNRLEVVL